MDDNKVNTLHAGVKDFLQYFGYEKTFTAFQKELEANEVQLSSEPLSLPGDEEIANAKDGLMHSFLVGNHKHFWLLWNEHIPENLRTNNDTQRLEFKLNLYFAVFSLLNEQNNGSSYESMQDFKNYLETKGAGLSQTTEFVAYYALPFVPNPKNHPTFKVLFEKAWKEELTENLSIYLQNTLECDDQPFLYKLLSRFGQHQQLDRFEEEEELEELKVKLSEQENRSSNLFKKLAKLQGDYHNLIGIAAELVDSLERCVRGQMITPDYLQDICGRLFGSTMDRPGSAASMLRASIQNDIVVDTNNIDLNGFIPPLDFSKIKADISGKVPVRRKALLLQALIWRLIKSKSVEQRNNAIFGYISHDIIGCRNDMKLNTVSKIFETGDDGLMEYLARFINVIASFAAGRQYLSQSEAMISKLVEVMVSHDRNTLLCENILGGLQKLSLRRNVQSLLIDYSIIEWLVETLEEPDNSSDYALEYTVALLMNLCLRVAGKKRCSKHPEKMLKLLSELLGFENTEIRQYINGTLYSILQLPSFKNAATIMGLEEMLKSYVSDPSQDERQLRFILKQLNNRQDGQSDNDIDSEGDDDDDDDEEGDAVETECEKPESICALKDEECGEQLLGNRYSEYPNEPKSHVSKIKKSRNKDGPLTRPTTPRKEPVKSSSAPSLSNFDPRFSVQHEERPHTASSRGAKQGTNNNNKPKKKVGNFKQAFTSRPKIPRSPDIRQNEQRSGNSPSPDIPPLTRSLSPPRPGSGKR